MSTLKVNTIQDTTGNDALTIDSSGNVTASQGFVPSTQLSHRNLIINGAMNVWQRGTSETGLTSSGFVADRFQFAASGTIGTYTMAQSTSHPDGFSYSLKLDTTTADASPSGTDNLTIRYKIEAQDMRSFAWGTSSAKSLTLSFWCRSNKTGDIQVNLRNQDANRMISSVVTISASDTWEYKTVTVAGDTNSSAAFNRDNGEGLRIEWFLDVGTDWSSGTAPTSWESTSAGDLGAGVTLALADNTANEFYLTGVQLEAGSVATPFEHRSYGEELARCQRYYEKSGLNNPISWSGDVTNTATYWDVRAYMVQKRTTPTITVGSEYAKNGFGSAPSTSWADTRSFRAYASANNTFGGGYFVFGWTADAEL